MMRCRTTIQENLYRYYLNIGKNLSDLNRWNAITESEIWKLPIHEQYGGKELGWGDSVSAAEGLVSSCSDPEFIASLVSQFLSLYLIQTFAAQAQRETFLPQLMAGKLAAFSVRNNSNEKSDLLDYSRSGFDVTKLNLEQKADIIILISHTKIKNDVSFFIFEKAQKSGNIISSSEDVFIGRERSNLALYDFLSFGKLFYGVLATRVSLSMIEKSKKCLRENKAVKDNIVLQEKLTEMERMMSDSRGLFYDALERVEKENVPLILSQALML